MVQLAVTAKGLGTPITKPEHMLVHHICICWNLFQVQLVIEGAGKICQAGHRTQTTALDAKKRSIINNCTSSSGKTCKEFVLRNSWPLELPRM